MATKLYGMTGHWYGENSKLNGPFGTDLPTLSEKQLDALLFEQYEGWFERRAKGENVEPIPILFKDPTCWDHMSKSATDEPAPC